jgi:hypothetical protein
MSNYWKLLEWGAQTIPSLSLGGEGQRAECGQQLSPGQSWQVMGSQSWHEKDLPFWAHETQSGKNSPSRSLLKRESFSILSVVPREYLTQCGKPHELWGSAMATRVPRENCGTQLMTGFKEGGGWKTWHQHRHMAGNRWRGICDFEILLVRISLYLADPILSAQWNCQLLHRVPSV